MVVLFGTESTKQFKKAVKKIRKRNKDIKKLAVIIKKIAAQNLTPLDKDHPLKGDWVGYRECHIEPNWLLVYRIDKSTLILVDTGSHSDIFGQ